VATQHIPTFLSGEIIVLNIVGVPTSAAIMDGVTTYLDRILADHRSGAANDRRHLDDLAAAASAMAPCRGFRQALAGADGLAVISELKRRSPSKGALNLDFDPAALATTYAAGGASCLSVLTDADYFGGSVSDLRSARQATSLPVLRKDFTVSANDVCDTRLFGADCVLLIAAALSQSELIGFHRLATDIGLDVLVEIHDEAELELALLAQASLIGVNQRDLVTFQVDHQRAERMARLIPDSAIKVAESGVRDAADALRLHEAGYHAVLVGETLVTAADPADLIRQMRGRG
jgi:indole-3-glycerol phosphate synthase